MGDATAQQANTFLGRVNYCLSSYGLNTIILENEKNLTLKVFGVG